MSAFPIPPLILNWATQGFYCSFKVPCSFFFHLLTDPRPPFWGGAIDFSVSMCSFVFHSSWRSSALRFYWRPSNALMLNTLVSLTCRLTYPAAYGGTTRTVFVSANSASAPTPRVRCRWGLDPPSLHPQGCPLTTPTSLQPSYQRTVPSPPAASSRSCGVPHCKQGCADEDVYTASASTSPLPTSGSRPLSLLAKLASANFLMRCGTVCFPNFYDWLTCVDPLTAASSLKPMRRWRRVGSDRVVRGVPAVLRPQRNRLPQHPVYKKPWKCPQKPRSTRIFF